MRNLLHANFLRLWKSRIFWVCMALMLFSGLGVVYNLNEAARNNWWFDAPTFLFFDDVWLLLAAWYSSFISEEYGDGIIRNKLMVGATRPAIYFANLISCIAAGLLMCAVYIIPNWALTYVLFGQDGPVHYIITPGQTVLMLWASVAVMVSYSAIFSMAGMNIQHKAAGPVAVVLTAAALYVGGYVSDVELALYRQEPERFHYSKFRLFFYQLFAEWLPGGQGRIYCSHAGNPYRAPVLMGYSLVAIAVSTGVGLGLFRRKDLK